MTGCSDRLVLRFRGSKLVKLSPAVCQRDFYWAGYGGVCSGVLACCWGLTGDMPRHPIAERTEMMSLTVN